MSKKTFPSPEEAQEFEKLREFEKNIGKKFTVGAPPHLLTCEIEYVDFEKRMVGSLYGEFAVSLCTLKP